MTQDEQDALLASLATMSPAEKLALLEDLDEKEKRSKLAAASSSLLGFAHAMYPGFKEGPQHRIICKIFDDVIAGKRKRVIINIAPRHSKSETSSYLLPAYFMGKYPEKKIIMGTHTSSLSEDFGRRVRNLIESEDYQKVFPDTCVAIDQKAAGKWSTSLGGQYYAVGVGGALAGRGADLCIIDDPHALTLDTLVPTPQGFKTVEELQIGDEVFGPDGLPTRILVKSEVRHERPLYEVETDDGEVIHCDGGHLWSFHSETALAKSHLVQTTTTRDLAAWSKPNRPTLPRHAAAQYPAKALPIDPYVLGAWLGDGTSTAAKITSHPDDQPFMRAQFEQAGHPTTDQADPYNFGVLDLWHLLKDMYLLGNKHIPEVYLTASTEQRMALLQGLMDTDGTVTTAGQCSFQNTNMRLVEGVRELLHSLGHKTRICTYYDNRGRHVTRQADHRVNFKMANAFRMPRKNERTFTSEDKRRRTIVVRPTDKTGAVQCITVDRADGLFLVGRGYVVTHNSEQDMKTNSTLAFDNAWTWFQTGPLQRLMPGGALVVLMTRWSLRDLTGKLLDYQTKNPDSDKWEIIELPAILNENGVGPDGKTHDADGKAYEEKSLWPEMWSLEALKAKRAGMDPQYWNAQYQQNPTSNNAAIISRTMWKLWEKEKPPKIEYLLASWDTAHEVKTNSDYSACTVWGIWYDEERNNRPSLMLMDAFKARWTFPELKQEVLKNYREWEPDCVIVEKKAAGGPLIQELRAVGIPVQEFSPSRGNDKIVRLNAVADLFATGVVWAPDTRWAKDVIEEVASFPQGDHDDFCFAEDTLVRMANGAQKYIQDVQVGDMVATPTGPQAVEAAGQTGEAEIWRVEVDGRVLLGTANHPVMTTRGWIQIDKLRPFEDTVETFKGVSAWRLTKLGSTWKSLFSMVTRTAGTPTVPMWHTGVTLGAQDVAYTATYGSISTALSHLTITCTTSTKTLETTRSKIWNVYLQSSIGKSISRHASHEGSLQSSASTSTAPEKKRLNGTALKPAACGMLKTLKSHWLLRVQQKPNGIARGLRMFACAVGAAVNLLQKLHAQYSAPRGAKRQNPALKQVRAVQCTHTTQPVFNLTVEGAHCFYANDILVHNCDTVSQALLRYRQGGFIPIDTDEKEDQNRFRARRAAYY